MSSALARAIQGYAKLGTEVVDDWTKFTKGVVGKVNSGTYNADKAVADAAECARLTAWTSFRFVTEALDAIAIVTDRPAEYLESTPFPSGLPGASLVLDTDLTSKSGNVLPLASVTLVPSPLPSGQEQFWLRTPRVPRPSGIYKGTVTATLAGPPPQTNTVNVRIRIP